jgi:hypothetical protein
MGREETEAELPIPGQEEQVSHGICVGAICAIAICKNAILANARQLAREGFHHDAYCHLDRFVEGLNPMNMELADLCIFFCSTITVVCRGHDMAVEMMPECSKTKT